MGILIGCEKISHEWPNKTVLRDQTIGINEGDRIGIVGKNGDGKSTLLQLIAHELTPNQGTITWRRNLRVGLLAQADSLDDTMSVQRSVVGDMPEYQWAQDTRIREILSALLADIDWGAQMGTLSGGQRRRVDLARVLIGDWDVLLMDEPTNHLDMNAIHWLCEHLRVRWQKNQGALLLVTHDRWFLDEVCLSMWEVHNGLIDPFEGGYSAYIQQRVERQRQQMVSEQRRQNILRKELAWLSRGAQARSTKPKFRVEAARKLIAEDPPLRDSLQLKRLALTRLGKQGIELKDVSYVVEARDVPAAPAAPALSGSHVPAAASAPSSETTIIKPTSWIIGPGDRIGIVGENGAGKTTLLKLMTGKLHPQHGRVKIGKTVRFGFLTQNLDSLRDKQDWRVQEILQQYKQSFDIDGKSYSPQKLLELVGFNIKDFMSRICDLSGGQLRRLALMCVLLEQPNVLILDEPGNDLDTDMLAQLEDLLDSWPGTLLMVTHDRYLMERVCDNQFALIDGTIRHLPGGIDEYFRLCAGRQDRRAEAGREGRGAAASDATDGGGADSAGRTNTATSGDAAASNEAAPTLTAAQIYELKKQHASTERKMKTAQANIAEIKQTMLQIDPTDYVKLEELQTRLEAERARLDDLETQWLALEETLETDHA